MMHFCSISNELEFDQWNYEGGNIEMLMKMVDLNGGYTLVPSNYQLPDWQQKDLHSIFSSTNNESPAREIIALFPKRSVKDAPIELLIREIQHKYSSVIDPNKFQLLGWE
jgi:DNA-binding transcriptional LysR family regulator